jgi:hypothetical protein
MKLSNWVTRNSARARALRPTTPLRNIDSGKYLRKYEGLTIFIISLVINLGLAYGLTFIWHIGHGDAVSRTANAFYVLYSREPHLAAVGFAWPPLPSLLQLPLIPILKALGNVAFTGNILSSIFGAATLVVMNRLLANLNFPAAMRWVLLGLLQFHPATLYLFASGMAEPVFLFFVIVALYGMSIMPTSMRSWIIVGISLALAFFVRYESLAMIAGVGLAIIVHLWDSGIEWRAKTEGWLLAVLVPPIYGIALWLFFNWTLLGDPLYFYRSYYSYIGLFNISNTAKVAGVTHPLYLAYGNIIVAIKDGIIRSFQQNPAYPVVGVAAIFSIFLSRNRKGFGLFIVMFSVTAFTILQVFLGSLANWLRYWFYAAPFALVMAGIVNEKLSHKWRIPFYTLVIVLFIIGTPISLTAMQDTRVSLDEQRFSELILTGQQDASLRNSDGYYDAPIVAKMMDHFSEKGLVLVDSSISFSEIMAVKYPQRLFITNDTNYAKTLADPIGTVAYILVLDPKTENSENTINLAYPTLFESGASWANLVWDSGSQTINHWRIYELHS